MSLLEPWNLVYFVGFVFYVGIRGSFARQTKDNEITVRHVDSQEKILLISVIVSSLLLPLLYLFTPLLGFADYILPTWVRLLGTCIMLVALWLFWRSHADLGANWSVTLEMRKDHKIIKEGVYRRIRHPMYAAIWLWCLAQGMLLQNWLAGWSALLAFACMYFIRTPREEKMLRDQFGPEYEQYTKETGRLFPRMFARREVDH